MLRYILKRLVQGIFVLLGVSIVIFALSRIIPGDPARLALGQHATQEAVDTLSKQMYLDKPLPVQYALWFRDVLHGNFGISLATRRSVTDDMKQLLPATFELIFWAALFIIGGSLLLGRAAAKHRDGILDGSIRVFSYIGIAVPSFVMAILLLVLFGNVWQIIPTLGRLSVGVVAPDKITGFYVLDALLQGKFAVAWDAFLHLLLPAFALSLGGMFQDARLTRSALTDNMGKEYMCVSRSYGLPEKVLTRARAVLKELEEESGTRYVAPRAEEEQVSLSAIGEGEALDAIRRCQPDTMTPMEAMTLLYELKRKLQ